MKGGNKGPSSCCRVANLHGSTIQGRAQPHSTPLGPFPRLAGKAGARLKAEDSLEDVVFVHDHDRLLFFTEGGQAFALKAYEVPEGSRTAQGTAIAQVWFGRGWAGWVGEREGP